MFVAHELAVGTGLREAQARFANLLHGAWLAEASAAAYDGAVTGLLRVGPAGFAAAKLVRVSLLETRTAAAATQHTISRSTPASARPGGGRKTPVSAKT